MPRQARLRLPGVPFHIVQRGHNRDACFRDDEDLLLYTGLLGKHRRLTGTSIHAYALMTNHVHLLLTGDSPDSISNLMKAVAQFHAQAVNRKYGLKGAHWEGRFRSTIREAVNNGFALGSDAFHSRVSKETGLRTRPSRRGRPPKSGTVPNLINRDSP